MLSVVVSESEVLGPYDVSSEVFGTGYDGSGKLDTPLDVSEDGPGLLV